MNNNNEQGLQMSEYRKSDGVYIAELIRLFWRKKSWIFAGILLGGIFSGLYAFTAKEQWTSKAELTSPKSINLNPYFVIRAEYARILGDSIDVNALGGALISKFDNVMYSLDEREKFFLQSDIYKNLSEGKSESEKRKILYELSREQVKITKPDPKKEPDLIGRQISFWAENPEVAQNTLKSYLDYLSKRVYGDDAKEYANYVEHIKTRLQAEVGRIAESVEIKQKVKLENLGKALSIARSAGIKEFANPNLGRDNISEQTVNSSPSGDVSISDSELGESSYLFLLGERYLKAKIDIIEKQELIYPPKYYEITERLKRLDNLPKLDTYQVPVYDYISSPDYPISKDSPKRLIILLFGMVLGGFIGVCSVLLNSLLKQENDK